MLHINYINIYTDSHINTAAGERWPWRPSPKVDWSNFSAKLKKACEETSDVKSEGASGSGLKNAGNAEDGQRKTRTKRKPVRYIDSSDEEEEEVDLKRVKPEPTNTPSSACEGPSSESILAGLGVYLTGSASDQAP